MLSFKFIWQQQEQPPTSSSFSEIGSGQHGQCGIENFSQEKQNVCQGNAARMDPFRGHLEGCYNHLESS